MERSSDVEAVVDTKKKILSWNYLHNSIVEMKKRGSHSRQHFSLFFSVISIENKMHLLKKQQLLPLQIINYSYQTKILTQNISKYEKEEEKNIIIIRAQNDQASGKQSNHMGTGRCVCY